MSDPTAPESGDRPATSGDAASSGEPSEAAPPPSQRGTFWTVLVIVGLFLVNVWMYSPLSNKSKARPAPGGPGGPPRPAASSGDPGSPRVAQAGDPRTPSDGPRTPGDGPRSPGSAPRTPGDGPRTPGDGPRTPGDGPRSPGSDPRTPGDGPRSPGSDPRTPGDGPRSPGSAPRTPGDAPRTPGDGPRTPGDGPRSPGSDPRPPGSPRPRSPLDGEVEGSPRPGAGDRRTAPPPAPGMERRPAGGGISFHQVLGITLLEDASESLRLDATQKAAIRAELRTALPKLAEAYKAQGELQELLTSDQIEYLNSHRGPITYKGKTLDRPSQDQTMGLLAERLKEAPATEASPAAKGGEKAQFALDLDELLVAPLRLEADKAVRLSPAQARQFHDVMARVKEVDEIGSRLSSTINKTLRPDQVKYVQSQGTNLEATRHVLILRLVNETLSRPAEK